MMGTRGQESSDAPEPAIASLVRTLGRLEARVEALERRLAGDAFVPSASNDESESPAAGARRTAPRDLSFHAALSLAGQACLVLCGAFLLRALTDRDALPLEVGSTLGLVYALAWLFVAERFARRGKTLSANLFGITSAVVAFPLVWESATRFGVVAGGGAALLIAIVTLAALALAWRRDLALVAWVFSGFAALACFALMLALHALEPFAVPLILVGAVTSLIAHERRWGGLHWPAAVAADLYVLVMLVFVGGSNPELQWIRSTPAVMALALALLVAYLASFVGQILVRQREVRGFELVQTAVALAIGLGGAAYAARVARTGATALAAGALVAGLASYAVAFTQTKLRWKQRRNFMFYAGLGFALTLAGIHLLGRGPVALGAWCVLGVAGAVLGTRFRRVTLHYHGAAYLAAAAFVSELVGTAVGLFALPADTTWPTLRYPALFVLLAAVVAYVVLAGTPVDPRRPKASRIPRLAVALVGVLGCGSVLISVAVAAFGNAPPAASAAAVAATRTVVLSMSAIALAALANRVGALELKWIVYPVLALCALKLLIEDLNHSTPTALFIAFGAFGLSLIVSQHVLRRAAPPERGDETAEGPGTVEADPPAVAGSLTHEPR